ncbi:hypothetical protein [Methylobacterium aerolatum]|uniref:Uncharacterized protein n=1 Tax=Methylobacterium aerolatum TaxID=418708 RepID=A0ABU0HVG2_9HYPH|nr:hypothetical protein [Methylobacterium aerolatum]MDQ0446330.1 hypothetical protein [Methylobacterium aerolatum]
MSDTNQFGAGMDQYLAVTAYSDYSNHGMPDAGMLMVDRNASRTRMCELISFGYF